jgi:hypothetical protein
MTPFERYKIVHVKVLAVENGLWIGNTERLHLLDVNHQFRRDLFQAGDRVYFESPSPGYLGKLFSDALLESFAKLGYLFLFECKSCCQSMAAKANQMFPAGFQGLVKIKSANAAA